MVKEEMVETEDKDILGSKTGADESEIFFSTTLNDSGALIVGSKKQQKYLISLTESELILCPIHHISVKLKTNMSCVSICLDVRRE